MSDKQQNSDRFSLGRGEALCLIVCPNVLGGGGNARTAQARLQEASGLAEAIGLKVFESRIFNLNKPKPATYLGSGVVEEIGRAVQTKKDDQDSIEVIIVDCALSPVQQRNLEKHWQCKVIDRTGLILEIFGERARTKEGRMQVELAALSYQRSRLVRSWTHLERQRGGHGVMGGPGERQIESDRRMLDDRMTRIKQKLVEVKRTRNLHREARRRVPYPVVALVGYTNAGKSTLFNSITNASVLAEDQLFATLDPTMRRMALPSGRSVILSDTVGFISELPHELVIAFHATLEEVQQADVVLHVRDISHPDTEAQKKDVLTVLKDLDLDISGQNNVIEVLNKIDLLPEGEREQLVSTSLRRDQVSIALSAETKDRISYLLAAIDEKLSKLHEIVSVTLTASDGRKMAWLYQKGDVLEREDNPDNGEVKLRIRLSPDDVERFRKLWK